MFIFDKYLSRATNSMTLLSSHIFSTQKTNNVLERYNCIFQKLFPGSHPNLSVFVDVLFSECGAWKQRWEDAQNGVYVNGQERDDVEWPEVPKSFLDFVADKKGKPKSAVKDRRKR
jgi:hypothetical protein